MNKQQEARLASINNQWPVARWKEVPGEVHVWCDDGDEAMIHEDGTATWRSTDKLVTPEVLDDE